MFAFGFSKLKLEHYSSERVLEKKGVLCTAKKVPKLKKNESLNEKHIHRSRFQPAMPRTSFPGHNCAKGLLPKSKQNKYLAKESKLITCLRSIPCFVIVQNAYISANYLLEPISKLNIKLQRQKINQSQLSLARMSDEKLHRRHSLCM